jgi:hypothetical protein
MAMEKAAAAESFEVRMVCKLHIAPNSLKTARKANRLPEPSKRYGQQALSQICSLLAAGGRPLGEGLDNEQSRLAEAWQAARATGQPISSWGGQIAGSNPAASSRTSDRFQLSFSADGSAPSSADGRYVRKQDTWISSLGTAAAAAAAVAADESAAKKSAQEAAARQLLSKHGFMVDDLVGDDPDMAVQRSQWKILLLHVISILQRCVTAIMFGFFHFQFISATQLGILITLHAGFIGYLVAVRPYASWLLLLSDVLAYLCELTVLAVAVLLQRNPEYTTHQQLAHALVACYFFDVAAMVVPELIRYGAMGWAYVQARKQRQQHQLLQGVIGEGQQTDGRPSVAKADGVVTVCKKGGAKTAAAAALKLSGSARATSGGR